MVPLFFEVFTGSLFLRFFALPLRYGWAWWFCRPVLKNGWLPTRAVALGLAGFSLLLSGVTLADLLGFGSFYPGWFLSLEWWQRPIYPWLAILPRSYFLLRPDYLWIACLWNLLEGLAVSLLLWRWRPTTQGPT